MQLEPAFAVVVRLEPRLRKMLRRVCYLTAGNTDLAQEAWSDVVLERCERVMETFNPDKGSSLDGYFIRTMRLYATKWCRRQRRFITGRLPRGSSAGYESVGERMNLDAKIEVESLLSQLSDYDQWLVRRHVLEGYTFKEMRIALGISKGAVRCHFNKAMRKLAEIAGSGMPDSEMDSVAARDED